MMVTDVPLIDVIQLQDVFMIRRTVMTVILALKIVATQLLDVSIPQEIVTTITYVLRIGVMLGPEKLNMKQSFVMTRTHVPSNLAILSLDVSINQLTWTRETMKTPTNVSS